jgi:hypothetical protein
MLSKDRKKVLCDVSGCGQEAVDGCELRIDAGHGGDHITVPGDLIAWCDLHKESLLKSIRDEYILLDLEQLKARYIRRRDKRGRAIEQLVRDFLKSSLSASSALALSQAVMK